MGKFKYGDKVRVISLEKIDFGVLEIGDEFVLLDDGDVIHEGILYNIDTEEVQGWSVYEHQIELVEDDKKPQREQNYVQVAIGHLEEDLLFARKKLEEHKEAVEKAKQLIRDQEWIESDLEDEIRAIDDAIHALKKV